jgi:ankyrin repeat protein
MARLSRPKQLLEAQDGTGSTPLHISADIGNLAVLQLLMRRGAVSTIDNADYKGNTPLHIASKHGHKEIVVELISNGAGILFQNNNNLTALALAEEANHHECQKYIRGRIGEPSMSKNVTMVNRSGERPKQN